MARRMQVGIGALAALVLLAGCATSGQDEPADSPSAGATGSTAATAPATGNGSVYTAQLGGEVTPFQRHVIAADGAVGDGVEAFSGPATDDDNTAVIDGVGQALAVGAFSQYWTTTIRVLDPATGQELGTVDAPRWCGGEGLGYNPCVLLDATRMLRTTELGGPGLPEATITVSSLESGKTIAEFGPFPGLTNLFGTSDPDTVLITSTDIPSEDPPEPRPGVAARLDVTSGVVTEIGEHPAGWGGLCPIGTDSLLGFTQEGSPVASVVGPATIGEVSWTDEDTPMGCSADGRFLYLQRIPQPPGEEQDDTEAPNPATSLDRIDLATGVREPVLALQAGEWTEAITR